MSEPFTLEFTDDALYAELPWDSLVPEQFSPSLMLQARRFWTENAFNEYCSAVAMGQLATVLGAARVPTSLWARACSFPSDELRHVGLCARMARRCGGATPIHYRPDSLLATLDPSLSPLEQATELVLRVCCVGEAVSLPLLAGNLRAATHPLAHAVLERIVADEARHSRFGWDYLDWLGPSLDERERRRLGEALAAQLRPLRRMWQDPPTDSSSLVGGAGLGWMAPAEWAELARHTVERSLLAPLARRGIVPQL